MSPSSNGELRLAVYHRQRERDTEGETRREQGGDIGRAMKIERSVNERESDGESRETAEANRTSSRQRNVKTWRTDQSEGESDTLYIRFCVSQCERLSCHISHYGTTFK